MHRIRLISTLMVTLCVVACGDDKPTKPTVVSQPIKKAETASSSSASSTPSAAPYVYAYRPMGKRDPFRSPSDERMKTNESGRPDCTEPLCLFDLDQLSLVGVITGDANPEAMFLDSMGRGHIVRRNTKVGRQNGRVTQILRDSVTVTQFWTGPDGKVNPNPVVIQLKPDKATEPTMDLLSGKLWNK